MSGQAGVVVRVTAARVLDAVLHRGRSLKAELATALPQLADPRDRALLEAICFAALRRRTAYNAALSGWMPRPLQSRDNELRALLLAGLAQLDALQLPAHAALSATVEAARTLGRPHQAGMVNALLRRAQREGVPAADASAAWPQWLQQRLRADWPTQADALFAASAEPAPLWLRVNRRVADRDAYRVQLAESGIHAETIAALPDGLRLAESTAVGGLPGFEAGVVSVQDGSAQQVADLFALAEGARVLDACAAPGGKSAHLLERQPGLRLTALDVDARRLRRVEQTLQRVGATATLKAADASDPAGWWDEVPFDAVLLDAPCSATGIVRRQPDVLLHRRPEDIAALTALQARLLDAAWAVLAPGGTLVYATCSLLAAENAAQIEAFVARHDAAALDDPGDAFGHASGGGRQRLTGEDGMDGFFYARLRKAPA
ncbi:16S rRNA (cytosine(967)-C(5))-methyltransferase RsmB [Pseudoxanthomonas winnipegensis]|uniref:16S rRNA (cytosine(967)-C(5))-methyltransferase n=1 Tax=Pseudoxanthomonas winnipegensis TaxID=2480810 RepID=A0A4V2HDD1_9GAMM|nr:16S rRNA (cytosine(967)-C(5))-methyltransferase RsmB [Pseudoxanthomonas winnipegensis]TAA26882.1 16S rRNA (cytosine(967)-C(5))-methyltransferase RsmB [Pseudoxanthomonas winnipegensis]